MFSRSLSAAFQRLEFAAKRAISGIVSTASNGLPRALVLLEPLASRTTRCSRALDETVDVHQVEHERRDSSARRHRRDRTHALASYAVDGLYLEFGVRSGRSINHIARRRPKATVHGFDSFEGLPEPWTGYTMDRGAFGGEGIPDVEPNVRLHVGWFDDTLPVFLDDHPGDVAFVHIDSDIYSSALTILYGLAPRLRPGSIIVFNEYFNYPNWKQHEFRAFQEFCAESPRRLRLSVLGDVRGLRS